MTLFNENETKDTAGNWCNNENSTAPIEDIDVKRLIKSIESEWGIVPYPVHERYKDNG